MAGLLDLMQNGARSINNGIDAFGDKVAKDGIGGLLTSAGGEIGSALKRKLGATEAENWSEKAGLDGRPEGSEDAARHAEWMALLTRKVAGKLQSAGLSQESALAAGAQIAQSAGTLHEVESMVSSVIDSVKDGSLSPLKEGLRSSAQDFTNNAYGAEVLAKIADPNERRARIVSEAKAAKPYGLAALPPTAASRDTPGQLVRRL